MLNQDTISICIYGFMQYPIKTSLFVVFSDMICKVFKATSDKGLAELDFFAILSIYNWNQNNSGLPLWMLDKYQFEYKISSPTKIFEGVEPRWIVLWTQPC